jgi:hypothetical protein
MGLNVSQLWRNRLEVLLANIASDEREYQEIANLAAHVAADYHGRFLIELLQNAGDQAVKGGREASTVTIVRTSTHVALANEGAPFDNDGLRSVTSLGLSPKDPRFSLGNKGVGFKAVFQVTDAPEIYSAENADGNFASNNSVRLALSQTPLQDPILHDELVRLTHQILESDGHLRERLLARAAGQPLLDLVLGELAMAAPFKFPRSLGQDALNQRLQQLSWPTDRINAQTLVVLPLFKDKPTQVVVEKAIAELDGEDGTTILFLQGISQIHLIDHVRSLERRISRVEAAGPATLRRGNGQHTRLRHVATTTAVSGPNPQAVRRDWWIASRTLGIDSGGGLEIAMEERNNVLAATALLPGPNWRGVDSATVSVALPKPREPTANTTLGTLGRFCIGLPTHCRTGTPFWVDGRFHGNISRTQIEFDSTAYNALLFSESVQIVADLIGALKVDANIAHRRCVTLAMEVSEGPLADTLREPEGLGRGKIVLGADGYDYVFAHEIRLPAGADVAIFDVGVSAGVQPAAYGFFVPDRALVDGARGILEQLGGPQVTAAPPDRRFINKVGATTFIEQIAAAHRGDGQIFWHKFLDWILQFPASDLMKLRILPISGGDLAAPDDRVFIPPYVGSALKDKSDEPAMVPDEVLRTLRFLDPKCVQVRETGAAYTPLIRRLAPDTGTAAGLLRQPRLDELLNEGLIPTLQKTTQDSSQVLLSLRLLEQALKWVGEMSDTARNRTRLSELLVPAVAAEGGWAWVSPRTVYFSRSWVDERRAAALERAYGHRAASLLARWEDIATQLALAADQRNVWRDGLIRCGVADRPRILLAPANRTAALYASRSKRLARDHSVKSPWKQAEPFWAGYVDSACGRETATKGLQAYDFEQITWIDGLGAEASRLAVVDIILSDPQPYVRYVRTSISRPHTKEDPSDVPSLWAYAIGTANWEIIPTSEHNFVPAQRAWWLEHEQRRRHGQRYSQLPIVPARFENALPLLRSFGVATLEEASSKRFVASLHDLANSLEGLDAGRRRHATTLAIDLYARLQRVCARATTAIDLKEVTSRPLPLQRGRDLVPVALGGVERVYVDDDPVRARFIPDFSTSLTIPGSAGEAMVALTEALRQVIGKNRIVRTSEADVATGFVPNPDASSTTLDAFLKSHFPARPVPVDLGLLLAYGGRTSLSPAGSDFIRIWNKLMRLRIVFGTFPASFAATNFYDERDRDGPTLMVASQVVPHQVLEATWAVVGSAAREIWSTYAHTLTDSSSDRFFSDRRIGAAEREDVEITIGWTDDKRLLRVQAALFAVWLKHTPEGDSDDFLREWRERASSPAAVARWLEHGSLERVLEQALEANERDAGMMILANTDIRIEDWQIARVLLGQSKFEFPESVRLYEEARDRLVSSLMVLAARSSTVELVAALKPLADLRCTPAADDVRYSLSAGPEIIRRMVAILSAGLEATGTFPGVKILKGRIDELTELGSRISLDALWLDQARREVELYRTDPIDRRSAFAQETVNAILKVAVALGRVIGESVDADKILADTRLSALISGHWANRFSALAFLGQLLARAAPAVAKTLSDKRVFHLPLPATELWKQFPELTSTPAPAPAPPPPPTRKALGVEAPADELAADLRKGADGRLGQSIRDSVNPALSLATLLALARSTAPAPKSRAHSGGGSHSGFDGSVDAQEKELSGCLGEAFVFEQLRALLPEFDETNWVSANRQRYGLEPGSDTHGCDFIYRDVEGKLTQSAEHPECLIEVKSTGAEIPGPFPLSIGEWSTAQACHESSGRRVYVIIRVSNVRGKPRIADVLLDPVALWEKGQISLRSQDMWVYSGTTATT